MLNADLPSNSKSGVGYQVDRISQVLAERGHEVIIKSLSPAPLARRYIVQQINTPHWATKSKIWRLLAPSFAFGTSSLAGFDLIHAHGDNPFLYRPHTPIVRTFYGAAREEARFADRLRRRASQNLLVASERLGRRLATITVGISQNTASSLGGLDCIIPCGVDRSLFHPRNKSKNPSILYVGTISGRKRGRMVVDLFEKFIRPRYTDAELWLVADAHVDGDGIKSFRDVSDNEIAALFGSAWLFTLPSTYEAFGVPYIEAMASATPVVTTPNPGAAELIKPHSGGVISPDDKLAEAICTLLADEKWRVELGAQGLKTSSAFDWSLIADQYEKVYEEAISRVRRRRRDSGG